MKASLLSKLSAAKIRSIASNINFTGMIAVKGGQRIVGQFLGIVRLAVGSMSLSWVRVVKSLGRELSILASKQGIPGVVKYLKACSVMLQQSVGSHKLRDLTPLGPRVSRTKSGLPRIIPKLHRIEIRKGNTRVIRAWMTLFSVYRVLEFKGELKLGTITDLGKDISKPLIEILAFMPIFLREIRKFSPAPSFRAAAVEMNPLSADINQLAEVLSSYLLPAEPFHIRKSSPITAEIGKRSNLPKGESFTSTSLTGLVESARAIKNSEVWGSFVKYAKWTNNLWIVDRISELSDLALGTQGWIGKLGTKVEPAGKVRVFAMVDPWTQWLLRPLHEALFNILKRIPQDGTFDQMNPVNKLLEKDSIKRFWSYDLSAATDRLPVLIQQHILTAMFGHVIGSTWSTILVGRQYKTPKGADVKFVKYAVGQPMGALSSWAMLALTHHFIVQLCAYRVHKVVTPNKFFKWFQDYAVLGDDIVIANGRVAREYLNLMDSLGVGIGLAKSLVARNRTLEFAKRFITPTGDCSPISFKEMVVAVGSLTVLREFAAKFSVSHSSILSLLGYGYKVKGRMSSSFDSMTGRLSTTLLVLERGKYAFVDWVRLIAVGRSRETGEYPLSRFWLAVNRALLDRSRQVFTDRLRSLGKSLTIMARLSGLDLSSEGQTLEDVEVELWRRKSPVAHPSSEGQEWKIPYLRQLLAKATIQGSAIWADVSQKVEYLSDADARRMDPRLLYEEVVNLDDRLSSIQDFSVIEIRKDQKEERDQVIQDVRLWYFVRNVMRKPDPQSLVSPEALRKVRENEKQWDKEWLRVLWGFRLLVFFCVCLLVHSSAPLLFPAEIEYVPIEPAPTRRVDSVSEILGLATQEPVPGLWDPDPVVRELAKAMIVDRTWQGGDPFDSGFAVGAIAGYFIKGVLVISCLYGAWWLTAYGLSKIGYAIYYFGSTHPNVTMRDNATQVGQGIERLTVPSAPSITTGPFTPNTLDQVRSDLAYQAWMDNLDLSPIAALWE